MRRIHVTTRRSVQPRASRLTGDMGSSISDMRRDMLNDMGSRGMSSSIHDNIRTDVSTPKQRDIQRDMEEQLNQRRHQWENKLDDMQKDFFNEDESIDLHNTNYFDESRTKRIIPINVKINPNDAFDINLNKSEYAKLENGNNGYLMHFLVKGYSEEDLSINVEGRTVTLTAEHVTTDESGSTNKKTIHRKVDLPSDVEPDTMTSHISDDLCKLTIEAGLKDKVTSDIPVTTSPPVYTHTSTADKETTIDPRGLTGHIPYKSKKLANIQTIQDSEFGEMFTLQMDIGKQYKPEDVKVHILHTKFTIKATSESLDNGCRSINKWTRDFNVTKKIDQLKSYLEDGCINIYGVYSDCRDAMTAMSKGKSAVPISAVQCEVIMQQ